MWGRLEPQFTEKVLGSCNAIGKACCKCAMLVVPCSTSGARNQTKGGGHGVDFFLFCFVSFTKSRLIFYYIQVFSVTVPYLNHYGL